MEKIPAVYILAKKRNGTIYIGVTSDLTNRTWTHQNTYTDGFTSKYSVHLLVYYEVHQSMRSAITREKQLKKWERQWKINLIERENPKWNDLFLNL